ncbi:LysR family transcriptional regulator [Xanthobacter sp. KR7-65]|uniref:LysR family transcriptional regulator n=1 Tax=Xanthobacter sp. KR7-65 TaxID=3156612 RepID=UPI0032B45D44
MELRHLRYVIEAAERGSFRKAADSLAVQQSNLSRRIRALEEQIGIKLFERTNGGVRPTPAGREFLDGVRRTLADLQSAIDNAKAVSHGKVGHLAIGFYTSLSAGNLRASLIDYTGRFPEVQISIVEESRSRLCAGIHSGTIDVAILTGEAPLNDTRSMTLWGERVVVALPEDHRLAANEIIYWTDLKRERFLLSKRDPGSEFQNILISKLASPGELPDVVRHDVSVENIRGLVGMGRGVTLMCEACVGASHDGVIYREVYDGNGATRIGYSALWEHSNDNPALRNFIRLLEERCPPVADGNGPRGGVLKIPDPSP